MKWPHKPQNHENIAALNILKPLKQTFSSITWTELHISITSVKSTASPPHSIRSLEAPVQNPSRSFWRLMCFLRYYVKPSALHPSRCFLISYADDCFDSAWGQDKTKCSCPDSFHIFIGRHYNYNKRDTQRPTRSRSSVHYLATHRAMTEKRCCQLTGRVGAPHRVGCWWKWRCKYRSTGLPWRLL